MIELELKAVVEDADGLTERVKRFGARESYAGRMTDLRYDYPDDELTSRDEVVRLRIYEDGRGERASLDWKGPAGLESGYKRREEISTDVGDAVVMRAVLERIGLRVTRTIDRRIQQFELDGATIRLERYRQMDDLVEVEGSPEAIERAIAATGIPRAAFTSANLAELCARFTARTGRVAITDASESDV